MLHIKTKNRSGIVWGLGAFICAAIIFGVMLYNAPIQNTNAAGETITTGGSISGRVNQQIPISTISISGTGNDTIPVKLQVGAGNLYMTTTTGLTFGTATSGATIAFSGSRSDVNAALATLHYSGTTVGSQTLTISLADQNTIFNPTNGHVYQYVPNSLTWFDARDEAAGSNYEGIDGYLATITSQDENDFIKDRLSGDAWLGGSDDEQYGGEGHWNWAVGPEAATNIYNGEGAFGGVAVSGKFTNWASGEPNNAGDEDCMETYISTGTWNDLPCTATVSGYVIEYGDDVTNPTGIPTSDVTITTTAATFAGGDGSVGDPYQITDCERLQDLNQDLSANYVLNHDIDCSDTPSWNGGQGFIPIGSNNGVPLPFTGTIDGAGYSIDRLTQIRADDDSNTDDSSDPLTNQAYVGLIGYGNGLSITDLHLTYAKIKGYRYVGGLVGFMINGTITNTSVNQGIDESSDTSCNPGYCVWARYGVYGGGLVGWMQGGSISDSTVGGLVKGSGNIIGGLVGHMEGAGSISDSGSTAAIDGGSSIGGVVGEGFDSSTLTRVYATGNVIAKVDDEVGKAGWWAGGLVGNASNITITESYATGAVHADAYYVGGIAGQLSGSVITDVYSTGAVSTDGYYAGGLYGAGNYSTITRAYASGSVSGDYYVGGLIGGTYQEVVSDSFAAGMVTGNGAVGALVGDQTNIVLSQDYFDLTTTGQTGCINGGSMSGCDGINDTSTQPSYLFDYANAPFTQSSSRIWDENTWYFSGSDYPVLRMGANSAASVRPLYDDNDGVTAAVENAGPNGGDGNNDGIQDSAQANVVSFVNPVTSHYVTLEVDNACQITAATSAAAPNGGDNGYSYPFGLLQYTIDCGTPGFSTSVSIYYYDLTTTNGLVVRKYNATGNTYATVPSVALSGVNPVKVTYTLVDGSSLDEDGLVNGIIVDPVGLAVANPIAAPSLSTPGVPNTGLKSGSITLIGFAAIGGTILVAYSVIRIRRTLSRRG